MYFSLRWLALLLMIGIYFPCEASAGLFDRFATARIRREIPCAASIHLASVRTLDGKELVQPIGDSYHYAKHIASLLPPATTRLTSDTPVILLHSREEPNEISQIEVAQRLQTLIARLERAKYGIPAAFQGVHLSTGQEEPAKRFLEQLWDSATLRQSHYQLRHFGTVGKSGVASGVVSGLLTAVAFASAAASVASGALVGLGVALIQNQFNHAQTDLSFAKFFHHAREILNENKVGEYAIYSARQPLAVGAEVTESGVYRYPPDWDGVGTWQRKTFEMLLTVSIERARPDDPRPFPLVNLWIWEP